MTEEHSFLAQIKDWWFLIVPAVAFFIGYVELRAKVVFQGRRLDKIESDVREDIHRVEDSIATNHRELMGYIQGMNK